MSSSTFKIADSYHMPFIRYRLSFNSSVNDLRALRRVNFADANHSSLLALYVSRGPSPGLGEAHEANELCTDIISQPGKRVDFEVLGFTT
jgi:hypothetical protein